MFPSIIYYWLFELPLFRTIFCFPSKFKIVGFKCTGTKIWPLATFKSLSFDLKKSSMTTQHTLTCVFETHCYHLHPRKKSRLLFWPIGCWVKGVPQLLIEYHFSQYLTLFNLNKGKWLGIPRTYNQGQKCWHIWAKQTLSICVLL